MRPPSEPVPAETDDNPYGTPHADVRLAPPEKPARLSDERSRVFLKIGLVLCCGWPLLFGTIGSTNGGRLGMVLVFVITVIVGVYATARSNRLFPALSIGLFSMGLLSIIPIIPVMLGGILISVVTRTSADQAMPLGIVAASIVTALYGAVYAVVALVIGLIIQGLRRR